MTGLVPATPIDAAMLAIVHGFAFDPNEAWGPDAIALTLGLPGVFGFLQQGAGMILARATADESEVLTLAVVPTERRRGVARTLLAAAKQEAARRGAAAMFLEVSTANVPAKRLYESAGFAAVGRRKRYYADGTDALLLRSLLAS